MHRLALHYELMASTPSHLAEASYPAKPLASLLIKLLRLLRSWLYPYFLTNICGIDRPSALSIPVLRSAGIITSSYSVIDVLALTRWELPL